MRVLDLSRLLPGPYATLVLSDLGAEVVKIEDPDPGDYLREMMPAMFAVLNRGKKSAVIDLRTSDGVATLRRLAEKADVLVESFRPGVLERLLPPPWPSRLVVCRISGFGQGELRAGHDIGYLAISGVLGFNRSLPGVQLADLFGGAQQAVIGILAALVEQPRGRVVDVSMTHGVTGLILPHLGASQNILDGSRPCYRVYACADGRSYALGALEPKFWMSFCAAVQRPDWAGRPLDEELVPEMDALFASKTRDAWDALLRPADCCGEPVLSLDEMRAHPLFKDGFVGDLPRTYPALVADVPSSPAPGHGEHTAEVLRDWSPA